MYEPVLVVGNGHDRRLAVAAVPVHSVAGETGFADAMQLALERVRHICCIAEGKLVAPEQEGVNYCQQTLLRLWHESGACHAHVTAGQVVCPCQAEVETNCSESISTLVLV